SRGQLREEAEKSPDAPAAFRQANTIAAFLSDAAEGKRMREQARNGFIWIDEFPMASIDDTERLCEVAKEINARLVFQGDPKQTKAVGRHGHMMEVLEESAGLPVARLTKIQRQKGDYAQAVAAIRDGKLEKGDAILRELGWVVEGQGHEALVAEYARAIEE